MASPARVPDSASTIDQVRRSRTVAVAAIVATSGSVSRASMASRPWIVDSAPELRLTTPAPSTPSKVRPDVGSYIAVPDGLLPKNHEAAIPATETNPGRRATAAAVSNDSTRDWAPYAIWTRSVGEGSQPFSGPAAISRCGVNEAV